MSHKKQDNQRKSILEEDTKIEYQNQPDNFKYIQAIFKKISESDYVEECGDKPVEECGDKPVEECGDKPVEEEGGDGGGDASGGIMTTTTDIAGPQTRLGLTHKRPKFESFKDYVLRTELNEGTWAFDPEGAELIRILLEKLKKELFYHLVGDDTFFDNIDGAVDRIVELSVQTAMDEVIRKKALDKKETEENMTENGTDFSLALKHGLKDYPKRVVPKIKNTFIKHLKDMGDK